MVSMMLGTWVGSFSSVAGKTTQGILGTFWGSYIQRCLLSFHYGNLHFNGTGPFDDPQADQESHSIQDYFASSDDRKLLLRAAPSRFGH
jgi:hypothetical protein